MRYIPSVSVTTISACPLRCNGCSVEAWRDQNPSYMLTLSQVSAFTQACVMSGYRIGECIITGGEPMMWPHLAQGAAMLRPIADKMVMFTNGILSERHIKSVRAAAPYLDKIRVSRFTGPNPGLDYLKYAKLPCSVKAKKKTNFCVRPDAPVEGVLPAACRCPHVELCGDTLYACSLMIHGSIRDGVPIPEGMSTHVGPGFMDRLDVAHVREMPMCAKCESNDNINLKHVRPQ